MNIRMSTKGKRPLRSLTPSDKIHAIQRIHDGESKASVARDIGVPESTLRGWCKNEDKLRFMSRQAAADKLSGDSLTDRIDGSSTAMLGGPSEKRPKLDSTAMPLNFSSKLKFEELSYKRASLNGLDYTTSKALSDLSFNGLAPEYAAFNGNLKNKVFGADVSRPADPSIAAISPLSSLSHISGLAGISQSPLAISFNELTSNLNLLAQLNPGLAAMSSLNGLATSANNLRSVKSKAQSQVPSTLNDVGSERQPALSVKNWAKQKPPHLSGNENDFGINLSQNSIKTKIKCPSPSLAPSLGSMASLPPIPEDPLLYWLKSQQAMLGLSSLYPTPNLDSTNSPIRSSTPQQTNNHADSVTPIASTPLNSTPASIDEKNVAWITWCKAFGASLNTLAPVAAATMHNAPMGQAMSSTSIQEVDNCLSENHKPPFENILYSHLTKHTASPSTRSSTSIENIAASTNGNSDYQGGKPEDLSAKTTIVTSAPSSPLPENLHSIAPSPTKTVNSLGQSPINTLKEEPITSIINNNGGSVADCKDVLDNLLYKINYNSPAILPSAESDHESEDSFSHESVRNNNNICTNNNNNSNKTDEEERTKCEDLHEVDDVEAIKHGEKFLRWLENCSNPRVTSVQLMQLRFLISAVKSKNKIKSPFKENSSSIIETSIETDENSSEETNRCKPRRRK